MCISTQAACSPLTGLVIGLCKVKVSPWPLAGKTLETKVTASETTLTMSFTTGEHTCLLSLYYKRRRARPLPDTIDVFSHILDKWKCYPLTKRPRYCFCLPLLLSIAGMRSATNVMTSTPVMPTSFSIARVHVKHFQKHKKNSMLTRSSIAEKRFPRSQSSTP